MGVSIEVWRQRVGCFSMPGFSGCRTKRSSTSCPRSSKIGIGTKILVVILIATAIVISSALIQYHLPARFNTLLTCGDIEQNPGARPSLLPDNVLEKVKSNDSSLQPLDYQLLNKHMQQLYTLRKTSKTTWASFVNWIKLLQPSFTFDDDDWTKRLCAQSKSPHCSAKEERQFQLSWQSVAENHIFTKRDLLHRIRVIRHFIVPESHCCVLNIPSCRNETQE